MNKKFISLVLTRQCNSRCSYCKINFENKFINIDILDSLVLKIENDLKNEYNIEFFGGEPLISYDSILYFAEKSKNIKNIKGYSIVTNGIFLDKEKILFLNENNIKVFISLHPVLFYKIKNFDIFKKLSNFEFNLILEPGKIEYAEKFLEKILENDLKYCKINILPVHYTVFWNKENLKLLIIFLKKLQDYKDYFEFSYFNDFFNRINNLSLYDKEKKEQEFIMDVDGKIFMDYESEFYLMKDFLPKNIFDYESFYVGNIFDQNLEFNKNKNIIFSENMKKILEFQKVGNNMKILSSIIKKYQIIYE